MTTRACQIVVILLAGACICAGQERPMGEDPAELARELSSRVTSAKSSCGRFMAVGVDRFAVHDMVIWLKDLAIRFEKMTGRKLEASRFPLITVYIWENPEQEPSINVSGRFVDKRMAHAVTLVNYEPDVVEQLLDKICLCLVSTQIQDLRVEGHISTRELALPDWLITGMGQNFYPALRKRNSEKMLAKWQKGRLETLQVLLKDKEAGVKPSMAYGVFVGWLLSFGKDAGLVPGLITTAARKGNVSAEDALSLLEKAGIDDPEQGWDVWLKRQERIVYLPGGSSFKDMDWMKAQLLIYPEDFGIPLSEDIGKQLHLQDLIRLKDNKEVRRAVKSRFIELELGAAGKSLEFRVVVEAYCRFLDGVVRSKSDRRLKAYLEEAEQKQRDFEIRTWTTHLKEKGAARKEAVRDEEKGQ